MYVVKEYGKYRLVCKCCEEYATDKVFDTWEDAKEYANKNCCEFCGA